MSDVLTICAWCPKGERITILNARSFMDDAVLSLRVVNGKITSAWQSLGMSTRPLKISDGICPGCKAEHFPETVQNQTEAKL